MSFFLVTHLQPEQPFRDGVDSGARQQASLGLLACPGKRSSHSQSSQLRGEETACPGSPW